MTKKTLTNCTEYQIEDLLRNRDKNIRRASQEQLTINEIIKDLAWPPKDKAYLEATGDQKTSGKVWIHPKKEELEREIFFREQTIDNLNHDVALANRFLKESELILQDEDYRILDGITNKKTLTEIGTNLPASVSTVHNRIPRIILRVQEQLRKFSV